MKFKFTIQPYQTEAVESVVGVFAGQPFHDRYTYRRDTGVKKNTGEGSYYHTLYGDEDVLSMGFANNQVRLEPGQLLANVNRIQSRNNLHLDRALVLEGLGSCSLDVEMETGTGKTYVYIKTMFELNKQYGWSKFIVVVPSVAIREGVKRASRPCRITSWSIMAKRPASLSMTPKT